MPTIGGDVDKKLVDKQGLDLEQDWIIVVVLDYSFKKLN